MSDIIEAAQTLLDFRSILGPELKAVSGDNARIQEIEDFVAGYLKDFDDNASDDENLYIQSEATKRLFFKYIIKIFI